MWVTEFMHVQKAGVQPSAAAATTPGDVNRLDAGYAIGRAATGTVRGPAVSSASFNVVLEASLVLVCWIFEFLIAHRLPAILRPIPGRRIGFEFQFANTRHDVRTSFRQRHGQA